MFFGNLSLKPELIQVFRFTQGSTVSACRATAHCHISYRLSAKNTRFESGGRSVSVKEGDVLFIPHGVDFTRYSDGDDVIVIHAMLCAPELNELEVFSPPEPEKYKELFERILSLYASGDVGAKYASTAELYRIMAQLSRDCRGERSDAVIRIESALTRIREDYHSPELSVAELSRECGMSEVGFRAAFTKAMGIRPGEYVTRYRVERAAQLLSVGGFKMDEIAERTGFCDAKYLATVFKRVTGVTPSEFVSGASNPRPYLPQ